MNNSLINICVRHKARVPSVKSEAIAMMVIEHHLSKRRVGARAELSSDSYRNPALPSELNATLNYQISEVAHTCRLAGYSTIHDLSRLEHPGVNHNRMYRFHGDAEPTVCRRAKADRYG